MNLPVTKTKRNVLRRQSRDTSANGRNVRPYDPYWQYTNPFIFRFVTKTAV